jgi:hypothetical protein
MSRKTFNFISVIVTSVAGIAVGACEYFNLSSAIAASIPVAQGAIITILGNFVKDEIELKK